MDLLFSIDGPPATKLWGNFLTAEERAQVIELARPRLVRSMVQNREGGSRIDDVRTSAGACFTADETPLIAAITRRAAAAIGCPPENLEPPQVLRYEPGQEYREHNDYFNPADPGSDAFIGTAGNRRSTMLIYLQAPDAGGETTLPQGIVKKIPAVAGNALWFGYPNASATDCALHGGSPVVAGEKWVMTLWERPKAYTTIKADAPVAPVATAPTPPAPMVVPKADLESDDPRDGIVVIDNVLSPAACGGLAAAYHRGVPVSNSVDHPVPVDWKSPAKEHVAKVQKAVEEAFGVQLALDTALVTRMPRGTEMANHADNVRWDGDQYVDNHTPHRTHTAVVFLQDGKTEEDGAVVYGDNPDGDAYEHLIPQRIGRVHAHACGPKYHHKVLPTQQGRYTLAIWFKSK